MATSARPRVWRVNPTFVPFADGLGLAHTSFDIAPSVPSTPAQSAYLASYACTIPHPMRVSGDELCVAVERKASMTSMGDHSGRACTTSPTAPAVSGHENYVPLAFP